jgi:hypothetical protein
VEKLKLGKGKAARDETEGKKEKCVGGVNLMQAKR